MDRTTIKEAGREPVAAAPVEDDASRVAVGADAPGDASGGDGFQDIVRLAALVCRTAVAIIIPLGRQEIADQVVYGAPDERCFKMRRVFRRLVVRKSALLVIEDTHADQRFWFDGQRPPWRFCAGVPLLTQAGDIAGTLCVFDPVARAILPAEAFALEALARQAVSLMELRLSRRVERDSEEHLGLIFDSAIDYAIVALGQDGRITSWNAGARQIFGWSDAEARGRPIAEIYTGPDREAGVPAEDLRKAADNGREIHERYYTRQDMSLFWGTGETMPLVSTGGAPRGYLTILRDRTAQKRVSEALEYQTGVLQAITDHLAEALFHVDIEHRITFLNPAAEAMFGWSRYELLGVNLHDRLHHHRPDGSAFLREDCPYVAAVASRALLSRRPDVFVHRDGHLVDVVVSLAPIVADGRITGAVMTLNDVTEVRKVEEALRRTQERYQLAVMASDIVGSWDWDLVTRKVVADARLAEQYGVDPVVAKIGAPLEEFQKAIHPDDRQRVFEGIDASIASGRQYVGEYRILKPDGSVRWVTAQGRCHYDPTGRPVRFPGLSVDITARKLGEERRAALLELEDRLRNEQTTAAICGCAAEIVCRLLSANRAGYGVFDATGDALTIERDHAEDGSASLAGTYHFRDYGAYGEAIKSGALMAIDDVKRDRRTIGSFAGWRATKVGAIVNVPLIAEGRLAALFFVHNTTPREWTSDDVALISNVADRTYAAISRAQSAERQQLLTGELHHRIKNTMAMVLAIAKQTMRSAPTMADAFASFEERLLAMSDAQNILTRTSWTAAPLAQIVESALFSHRPSDGERITVAGPDLDLSPQIALSFALALHELATNATKYGALSNERGCVSIAWSILDNEDEKWFRFVWREQGGPPVVVPTRKGFGSRLIQGSFPRAFRVSIDYEPDGVRCALIAPKSAL